MKPGKNTTKQLAQKDSARKIRRQPFDHAVKLYRWIRATALRPQCCLLGPCLCPRHLGVCTLANGLGSCFNGGTLATTTPCAIRRRICFIGLLYCRDKNGNRTVSEYSTFCFSFVSSMKKVWALNRRYDYNRRPNSYHYEIPLPRTEKYPTGHKQWQTAKDQGRI